MSDVTWWFVLSLSSVSSGQGRGSESQTEKFTNTPQSCHTRNGKEMQTVKGIESDQSISTASTTSADVACLGNSRVPVSAATLRCWHLAKAPDWLENWIKQLDWTRLDVTRSDFLQIRDIQRKIGPLVKSPTSVVTGRDDSFQCPLAQGKAHACHAWSISLDWLHS